MAGTRKILAAIDLGSDTEKILAYALWLCKMGGMDTAQIEMLYVLDYALTPPAYLMPYIEKEKESEEKAISIWAEKLKDHGLKTGHAIAVGRLVETFHMLIKKMKPDVLVLGHKSHVLRPSSSERMIRSLEVPMLVVRGQKSENISLGSVNIRRIICAVDFSEYSKKAYEFARLLAEESPAELILTHVVSIQMEKLKGMSEADKNVCTNDLIKEAEGRMHIFLRETAGVASKAIIRTGIPFKIINEVAMEMNADLIVIGARGLGYIEGMILGSVSEAIVKSSPCPVMIVH
ncbi:MAG: universal stress protein [Thermodesulfovibrionales bacterium]|nr:universal stress protein [Thermodesulfovibrionales bacterium]